jgi:hypothetical protein
VVANVGLEVLPDGVVGLDIGDVVGVPDTWSVGGVGQRGWVCGGLLLVLLEHAVAEQLHTTQNLGNIVGGLALEDNPLQTTHTLGDHVEMVLEG